MRQDLRLLLLAVIWCGASLIAAPVRANNSPEAAQRRVEEGYLPKINFACGTQLTVKFDGDSLRKYDPYIAHDQTDGERECNEPLRYLYAVCQTTPGRAAVKAAHIDKVICKGTDGSLNTLSLVGGALTVERSASELAKGGSDDFVEPVGKQKPQNLYARMRQQLEALLKLKINVQPDDPYQDRAWRELGQQPNPVTSTTTYCLVNGGKVAFDDYLHDPFVRRRQDATVKCWKDGAVVIDLSIKQGKKNGFLTQARDRHSTRIEYRDDKQHGEVKAMDGGKVVSLESYADGEQQWEKKFLPSGKLHEYSRKVKSGWARISLDESGKVFTLSCSPELRDDEVLKKWCGFQGALTTPIYDGTGAVSRVLTWKDGVLQKEGAGNSAYGTRSDVAYVEGKKDGEERVLGKNGQPASSINWKRGVKDGLERAYSDDGKKVVREIVWSDGVMKQSVDFFLNGNPKQRDVVSGDDKLRRTQYWDIGKVAAEGDFVRCEERRRGYVQPEWCEEGVHKSYFESGAPRSETRFHTGKRSGPAKAWWENRQLAAVEEYADGKLTKAKHWNKDGVLETDDEYEADGSRKLKR